MNDYNADHKPLYIAADAFKLETLRKEFKTMLNRFYNLTINLCKFAAAVIVLTPVAYLAICNIDTRLEVHYLTKNKIALNKVAVPETMAQAIGTAYAGQ